MATMKALVKDGSRVGLRRLPVPDLAGRDEVRVRVALTGLCRTDLYVADAFDFVLETGLSVESLRSMMAAGRPSGMLILSAKFFFAP
jgi:hypothetical protein